MLESNPPEESTSDDRASATNVVQSIETVDLTTSSPKLDEDCGHEQDQNSLMPMSLTSPVRRFYSDLKHRHRPSFMNSLKNKVANIKDQQIFVQDIHARYNRQLVRMTRRLEQCREKFSTETFDAAVYENRRHDLLNREQDIEKQRVVNDHLQSWKSYLGEWIAAVDDLAMLWKEIWDFVEETPRDVQNNAGDDNTNSDHNRHNDSADGDDSAMQLAGLYRMLGDLEVRARFASDGAKSHGEKALGLIQVYEPDN